MKIRNKIRSALSLNDPPERLALSFAIGVFVAFTPLVGLHTMSAILLASLFRVNKTIAITGSVLISNPYTQIPLFAASFWCGSLFFRQKIVFDLDWGSLSLKTFWVQLKPVIPPLVVGSVVLGIVASIASYFIFYYWIQRYRKPRE